MSKSNSPIKVLRTALKRVQKGWTKNTWSYRGQDGTTYVCLEGAVYGYCDATKHVVTPEQKKAIEVLQGIIYEKYGIRAIPQFNDNDGTTKEMVEEVVKLGIIRLETGGDIEDEEFNNLLTFKDERSAS